MSASKTRCWRYLKDGCRQPAVNSVRLGAHVIQWCADPAHAPTQEGK